MTRAVDRLYDFVTFCFCGTLQRIRGQPPFSTHRFHEVALRRTPFAHGPNRHPMLGSPAWARLEPANQGPPTHLHKPAPRGDCLFDSLQTASRLYFGGPSGVFWAHRTRRKAASWKRCVLNGGLPPIRQPHQRWATNNQSDYGISGGCIRVHPKGPGRNNPGDQSRRLLKLRKTRTVMVTSQFTKYRRPRRRHLGPGF